MMRDDRACNLTLPPGVVCGRKPVVFVDKHLRLCSQHAAGFGKRRNVNHDAPKVEDELERDK